MADRWTEQEDRFLVAYLDGIGADLIGPHDLGRSAAATVARGRKLKKTGAWQAYLDADAALEKALRLAGHI